MLTLVSCLLAVWEPVDDPKPAVRVPHFAGSVPGSPDRPAAVWPQSGSVCAGWSYRPGNAKGLWRILPAFVCTSWFVCVLQLDGYIARRWPTQKSALGSALDPLADKILISILYVSLTYADLIPGTSLAEFVCILVVFFVLLFHLGKCLCSSSVDSSGDFQRRWFDSCCLLGQIQDCSPTSKEIFILFILKMLEWNQWSQFGVTVCCVLLWKRII